MASIESYTFRELQKCAERELAMRINVYSKRGMTAKRGVEIDMMAAIVAHFKWLADCEDEGVPVIERGYDDASDSRRSSESD